jgi:voltage-gated potassium channel
MKAKKISLAFLLLLILIVSGTSGYSFFEGWNLIDSLYMTIITISTVGFREVADLSPEGKLFTIGLIMSSVGIFAYVVTLIGNFIVEGQFDFIRRRRRMERKIASLNNHYIVCGCGKIAKEVISEFRQNRLEFIVIANQALENLGTEADTTPHINADPTSDETLNQAKIDKAKGLVSCLPTDKENLFVVISARSLNPKLKIVSLATEEATKNKLLKAGADNVILPEVIGGKRMASMILRPQVLSFLDVMTTPSQEEVSLRLEELTVSKNSTYSNLSLKKAQIPQKTGVLVVAIKKKSGFIYNPSSSTNLEPNDTLIGLGKDEQIQKLKKILTY